MRNLKVFKEGLTVTQMSEITGISVRTINRYIAELYPNLSQQGRKTYLTESMVTKIKLSYQYSGRRDLDNVGQVQNINTDLEMEMMIKKVMKWQNDKIKSLQAENQQKSETLDLLMGTERTYTSTDIAKEVGFQGAKTLNKKLNELRIIYADQKGDWQPFAKYSECGYFSKKQTILSDNREVYSLRFTQKGREFILNKLTMEIVK